MHNTLWIYITTCESHSIISPVLQKRKLNPKGLMNLPKVTEIITGLGSKERHSDLRALCLTVVLYILKHFGFWDWNTGTHDYKLVSLNILQHVNQVSRKKEKEKPWSLVVVHFHGINIPTMVGFKPPMAQYPAFTNSCTSLTKYVIGCGLM